MYYQLYDLLSCIDHACNQEEDLDWIAQFWKHWIPVNMGYSTYELRKEIGAWQAMEIS